MRRSNRNIETFDISLMAVVTKAMGAFLVLMLLLMPYYSSGPIGQQAAADLSNKVEQVSQKINEVIDKLTKASPEDLRKLLDEALRMLDEARALIAELKRANDALQAQARRLEEQVASLQAQATQLRNENQSLRRQVEQLQAEVEKLNQELDKFRGSSITGVMTNFNCGERVWLDLYQDIVYTLPDKSKGKYVINFNTSKQARGVAANFAYFTEGGLTPGTYYLTAKVSRHDVKLEKMRGGMGTRLKRLPSDCYIQAGLDVEFAKGGGIIFKLNRFDIKQGQYAVVLGELLLTEKELKWNDASETAAKWLADQISNAQKDD